MTFLDAVNRIDEAQHLEAVHFCRDLYLVVTIEGGRLASGLLSLDLSPHHVRCDLWAVRVRSKE